MFANLRSRFKVSRHRFALRQRSGVVLRQFVLRYKTLSHHAGQFSHFAFHTFYPVACYTEWWQVWVREVAVIGRIFFGSHGACFAGIRVKQHGGLLDGVAVFNLLDLPTHFVVDGLLHELETVEVLDLATRAEFSARFTHRHVGVASERTFLHIAVANANPSDDFVQLFGVSHCLIAAAHVGFRHDF